MKTKSLRRRGAFAAILTLLMLSALGLLGPVSPAHGETIPVLTNSDTVADDGACSLREAIAAANTDTASGSSPGECPAGSGSDTITVPAMEILLGSRLVISSPMVLDGIGVGDTVVTAKKPENGAGHIIFLVEAKEQADQVRLRGLTVQGGSGGIAVRAGTVEIIDARIVGTGDPVFGRGGLVVQSGATVTVRRTTIDGQETYPRVF